MNLIFEMKRNEVISKVFDVVSSYSFLNINIQLEIFPWTLTRHKATE